ncbi:MAG TPA: hypothetical protein GX736_00230 [Mogibacterium sp.]|nr:hypothetical protein [Mogibacterium sp.]
MNKSETYKYLTEKSIEYEITEHKAVFNMEEVAEQQGFDKADRGTRKYSSYYRNITVGDYKSKPVTDIFDMFRFM